MTVQVGEVRDPRAEPLFFAPPDVARGLVALELAEVERERDLLLVGQGLIAKDQHGVRVDRCLDRGRVGAVERLRDIDARDFAGVRGTQLPDRDGHHKLSSPLDHRRQM